MPKLQLSAAFAANAYTRPLLAGAVSPEGVSWNPMAIQPGEIFWRQLHFGDFDVSEMSVSSLAIARSRGDHTWIGLPIFTVREFFHTRLQVPEDSPIHDPRELVGRHLGLVEYQQTAAVWTRGILEDHFGVKPTDVSWVMERSKERSHGGGTQFQAPPGIDLSTLDGSTLMHELAAGHIDAILAGSAKRTNLIDPRTSADVALRPLFADPAAEAQRYFHETGILPVNHCIAVRSSLVEEHPWLPLNIMGAFTNAKELALEQFRAQLGGFRHLGIVDSQLTKTDPRPYGIQQQRHMLDTLLGYLDHQDLVAKPMTVADIFATQTLSL